MNEKTEKIPSPKEIEKEIGDFLNKRFGGNIKVISPAFIPQKESSQKRKKNQDPKHKINFDLKPDELIAHLDQYIIKQEKAKAVLATKICTHFNRIKFNESAGEDKPNIIGSIKSNIIIAGPTGVGKTYMVKLIAQKIGVPFVKGDATKFSETGYVGGDVEDLVRDLVREANDDIELAQYGIIYIDEIDKIASNRNIIGADISRTGVQRALLKPMEDTDVELKVPHDPISIMQEIDRFQKTGKREKKVINTGNILFIVSGAFGELSEIIKKRLTKQSIGFGAKVTSKEQQDDFLRQLTTEDLIEFGFESEFIGRLPVRVIFERLQEKDLYQILKNPNNPLILGKKLDFASYGIAIRFDDQALVCLAKKAFWENTGARGLVSAIESSLIPFENKLPSVDITTLPITKQILENSETALEKILQFPNSEEKNKIFKNIADKERRFIKNYIETNWQQLSIKHKFPLSPYRNSCISDYYCNNITDIGTAIQKIKRYYDDVKNIEAYFFDKHHNITIIFEDDAIDFIIEQFITNFVKMEDMYVKISFDFGDGLKLLYDKAGKDRFLITKQALMNPEQFLSDLIQKHLGDVSL